ISRDIGTYDISIRPYEDCCTIFVPKSPKTRPKRDIVNELEANIDFQKLLKQAVEGIEILEIHHQEDRDEAFKYLLYKITHTVNKTYQSLQCMRPLFCTDYKCTKGGEEHG